MSLFCSWPEHFGEALGTIRTLLKITNNNWLMLLIMTAASFVTWRLLKPSFFVN